MKIDLHLRDETAVDTILDVTHDAHVQRRVRQRAVYHRQTENRQENVENADHEQIPVEGIALLQPANMTSYT